MSKGNTRVALITGAARRIGAAIARTLHQNGINVIIHYRSRQEAAEYLCHELNKLRPHSATSLQADLCDSTALHSLANSAIRYWGRLDILINNASSFYATPIGKSTDEQWDDLIGSNLKAPFFLAQALAEELKRNHGCIINMADIYAQKTRPQHTIYCCAKAGNVMLTKSLAQELAPEVRVNGIAPGAILWPEENQNNEIQKTITQRTALKRVGSEADITVAVMFLVDNAAFITGHVMPIDGGRNLAAC